MRTVQGTGIPNGTKPRTRFRDEGKKSDGDLDWDQSRELREGKQVHDRKQRRVTHKREVLHVKAIHTDRSIVLKLPRTVPYGFHRHRRQGWGQLNDLKPTPRPSAPPRASKTWKLQL
eukprot:5580595-Pyramimonas_sp.AAC.1